jgi:ATP-dependent helicase HepA
MAKGSWSPGDRLTHRFNPELGPGRVVSVEGRIVVVEFPGPETTLRLAADSDALAPLVFSVGSRVRRESTGQNLLVHEDLGAGRLRLSDGTLAEASDLWPLDTGDSPTERLARGELDPIEDFAHRLDALHLAAIREAEGMGSFLGGRIRLFPHQLYVALRATRTDPVRWLLSDEVGLGKTVESCLILNHLVRTGRAERVLVVAPETLTVQWLGELWRKYHQVFVLLDERRLADVEKDFGAAFNPFDVHRRVVIGLDTLVSRPKLTEQAAAAGVDLLIVDEAHHLRRPEGHPGNPAYRAIAPIAAPGRHALLLTATPLEDDAHGFFRLLQLLRPDEFPEGVAFEERLARGEPLPPCTSATRRADIGGLPPRVGVPVEIPDADAAEGWALQRELEDSVRALPADNAAQRKAKGVRLQRALSSGAALEGVLTGAEARLRELARLAWVADPRVSWLARQARAWKACGEKTLVFVARRETLEGLRTALSRRGHVATGVFHEDLSPVQRDIEVAQFRLASGPSMLVSTECGGEGRNFEFCHRLVMFDLPWNPTVVEQRIGRLDRIGRTLPVEIVYFKPPSGLGRVVVEVLEATGLFREPLGGLDRELALVEEAIASAALDGAGPVTAADFERVVDEARAARDRVRRAAYHQLHREPYRPEMAEFILKSVPSNLEALTEEVVRACCERLNLQVDEHPSRNTVSVELGVQALVETLPGVPAGSGFVGTFSRETAVEDEQVDFFASGHPLVEGLLAELEDSPRGRAVVLQVDGPEAGFGLLALYRNGGRLEAVAVDSEGRERPDWAALLTRRPLRTRRLHAEVMTRMPGWSKVVRRLASKLKRPDRPIAAAIFQIGAR